jgi:hypothetical protein
MNDARRKEIRRAIELMEQAADIITTARDEEEAAHDNLPESLQSGDQGTAMQEAHDALDEADTHLSDALEKAREATGD